jgi:hypothetical protein
VKACFTRATEPEGSAGKVLSRLLNVAVAAGKRVRSETSIAKGAVSISSAAAELAAMRSVEALGKDFDSARRRAAERDARGAAALRSPLRLLARARADRPSAPPPPSAPPRPPSFARAQPPRSRSSARARCRDCC